MAVCRVDVYFLVAAIVICRLDVSTAAGRVVNIAASATCTASIDCQPKDDKCTSCENAIDGNRYSTSWRYVGAAVGVWLQIVFDKTYIVSSLVIAMPFFADERHFKDMKLTFSDGIEHMITLTNKTGGWVTETFTIDPPRLSSSVKLTVISAYDVSSKTHTINEVEIYGKIPEMTTTSGLIETTTPDSTTVTPPASTETPSPTTPQDKVVNIAASATCTASIDCQPQDDKCTSCENAIDGNRHSTSWRYVGAAVGVWLQIVFERTYIVSSLVIAMPYWADERHFKDMKLTFTDGSEQTITLTNQNDGWVTETFIIDPPRLSSSVRLSVMSAYDVSSQTRVINEVEIYGKIPEMTTTSGLIETTTPDSTTVTPPATTVTPAPTTPQDRVVNITAKAKCSASFVCQPMEKYCSSCYSAIDGDKSTSWHYRGAAVGVWLQIVFDRSYNVSLVQIAPSYWTAQRHIKDMKLSFSDGGEQTITLSDGSDGWVTESFTIEPPRLSNSLKLSVVSAYDDSETLQNSVNEVGVYGFTRATPDPPQVTATTPSTIGDTKATHQQPNNPWKGRNLFILLGVVGAVLFVVVTLFVVNRRRQSRLPTSNVERGHDTPSSNEEHGYHDATNNEEHVYESTTGNGEHQYENTTSNEQNVYDTLAGNDEHGYETVG